MSIDVVITQKGLFKKTLPLQVILGDELSYGSYDFGFRLNVGQRDEFELIAYLPHQIGRGFSVIWNPKEKHRIVLRALTPTCEEELRAFYRCIGRITDYWKCNLEVDGNPTTFKQFHSGLEDIIRFNERALVDMCQAILAGKHDTLTLFSAMWPLELGRKEAQQFLSDPKTFHLWLHAQQNIDVYFAAPMFYDTEEGIVGVYVLTEDCESVFPNSPSVPFGILDPHTNQPLTCEQYRVSLFSTTENNVIGQLDYESWLEHMRTRPLAYYDGGHFRFDGLSLAELQSLLE